MRTTIIIASLFYTLASQATTIVKHEGGLVFICSSADNEFKITSEIYDGKGEKNAIVVDEGAKEVYPEFDRQHKKKYYFSVNASPSSLLEVRTSPNGEPIIKLLTDPENNHAKIATDQPGLKTTKLDADLSVPGQQITHEVVSCLETKWNN